MIGFWPVTVNVVGGVSYSCGTGFVHSRGTWNTDTREMGAPDSTVGVSTATPNSACPSHVYRHRDFGYALVGLAILTYAALLASSAFDPSATPMSAHRSRNRSRRAIHPSVVSRR
jgi:hypothetical protein